MVAEDAETETEYKHFLHTLHKATWNGGVVKGSVVDTPVSPPRITVAVRILLEFILVCGAFTFSIQHVFIAYTCFIAILQSMPLVACCLQNLLQTQW